MKNILVSFVSLAIVALLSSCAGTPDNQVAAGSPDEEVCRSFVLSGTKIPRKVCATAAEWERNDLAEQQQADRFFNDVQDNTGPGTDVNAGAGQ